MARITPLRPVDVVTLENVFSGSAPGNRFCLRTSGGARSRHAHTPPSFKARSTGTASFFFALSLSEARLQTLRSPSAAS